MHKRGKIKTPHRIIAHVKIHTEKFHKEFLNSRKTLQKKQKSLQDKNSTKKESRRKKVHKEKIHSIIFLQKKENTAKDNVDFIFVDFFLCGQIICVFYILWSFSSH